MKLPANLHRAARRARNALRRKPRRQGAPTPAVRPIGPVPPLAPFPKAKYLYAVNAVPRVHGGRTASILAKARIVAEQAGMPSTLVTFLHSTELANIEHDLRERGAITDALHFVCLHDYYPDDTAWTGADLTYPLEEESFHWVKDPDWEIYRFFDAEGVYRFYKRYDHAGRLIVRDHFNPNGGRTLREEFRTNGTLRRRIYMDLHYNLPRQEIHYLADQTPAFTVWWVINPDTRQRSVDRAIVFDHDGRPIAVHDSLNEINHLCLDRLIGDEHTFIVSEDRYVDRYLLDYSRANAKTIYVMHSAHIKEPFDDIMAVRPIYRPALEARGRVDAVVFLTARQRADAEARYGQAASFRVLPHSVPAPVFTLGIERDPNLVIMMARLNPEKQVDHAIDAFAKVVARLPTARLEIYGTGVELPALRRLIADLGLSDSVKLMGFTPQPSRVYQRASLCLLTSQFEGLGLVVLEAMSYGCPVISYDLRYGPADMIEDGVNGVLVPYGDRRVLADRIVSTLRSPTLLASLSEAARARGRDFGETAFAARWGALFSELDARGWTETPER